MNSRNVSAPTLVLASMRAAVYRRYGPPEVVRIEEVATPVPKDNEVLVRVHATTVCAADWRFRKTDPSIIRIVNGLSRPKRITILGMEFSGVVETIGKSVTKFRVGDPVFGLTGFKLGAHAEYVCMPEDGALAPKPATMSFEEAAAVLFGGVTSLYFLKKANIQPGQRVLIYGASGSVGIFAVQLAKIFGARVTGVSSTRNLELVKSLGADAAVDYTREDFSSAGRIYDVVFDTVGKGGHRRILKSLKRGGFYLSCGASGNFLHFILSGFAIQIWTSLTGTAKFIGGAAPGNPTGEQQALKELIEAGKLRTVIEKRYTLDQIAEAHRLAESGRKIGHVVIALRPQEPGLQHIAAPA